MRKAEAFYKSPSGGLYVIDMGDFFYFIDGGNREITLYPQPFEDEFGMFKEVKKEEVIKVVNQVVEHINSLLK